MANFINQDDTISVMDRVCKSCDNDNCYRHKGLEYCPVMTVIDGIKDLPIADVQPAKRGHWIKKSEEYYKLWQESGRNYNDMPYFITGQHFACGVCFDKYEVNAEGVEFWDFCPHCGADLREGL